MVEETSLTGCVHTLFTPIKLEEKGGHLLIRLHHRDSGSNEEVVLMIYTRCRGTGSQADDQKEVYVSLSWFQVHFIAPAIILLH